MIGQNPEDKRVILFAAAMSLWPGKTKKHNNFNLMVHADK